MIEFKKDDGYDNTAVDRLSSSNDGEYQRLGIIHRAFSPDYWYHPVDKPYAPSCASAELDAISDKLRALNQEPPVVRLSLETAEELKEFFAGVVDDPAADALRAAIATAKGAK